MASSETQYLTGVLCRRRKAVLTRLVFSWFKEGRVKYPWRVRLEPVKLGIDNFNKLMPKLSFIRNKKSVNVHLIGTPVNLKRSIFEKNAKLIIKSLR